MVRAYQIPNSRNCVIWLVAYVLASVTGFLERDPSVSRHTSVVVAALVGVAVFCSYPLQLYPALQVSTARSLVIYTRLDYICPIY